LGFLTSLVTPLINFHDIERIEVFGVREILECLFELLSSAISCALDYSRLELLPEALEVSRVVV
jgi:hypothetical protein